MYFVDRQQAGEELGRSLVKYKDSNTVIIGVPRGGVVVAAQVAKALAAPLDVIIPRKIGAPHNPEVAIGAVTQDGTVLKDEAVVQILGISDKVINDLADQVAREISRRVKIYRGGRPGLKTAGKNAILVDDGIATGYTIKAALQSLRKTGARWLVLAVPVAPADTIEELAGLVDELICLQSPDPFYAVGQCYRDFDQTTDEEVMELMAESDLATQRTSIGS